MKVYIGYQCSHDYASTYRYTEKVFDSLEKARAWCDEYEDVYHYGECTDWREYNEKEVE